MPNTNEMSLEKTFSDLAYSHLRDKSQPLLDYLVGFQMIKQEDDGKRAVGIFGFEIDEDYYYAPIFFLNGEIRGLDSLYSIKSDIFVPITEDWVNTIINKRQVSLGEKNVKDRAERGVHAPNYTRLKVIPGGSGAISLKLAEVDAMLGGSRNDLVPTLPEVLADTGFTGIFKQALESNPRLHESFSRFYNMIDLYDHAAVEKTAAEDPVTIINSITDEGTDELTDKQREDILAGGTVVIDKRPEVSKSQLYRSETKERLENPTGGGLYDIIMSDGTVELGLVAPVNDLKNTVFVRLSKDKCGTTTSRNVWCLRKYSDDELIKWLDKEFSPADSVRPDSYGVFVSKSGEGTASFHIDQVSKGLDDIVSCSVFPGFVSCCSDEYGRGKNNGNPIPNTFRDLFIGGTGDKEVCSKGNRPKDPNSNVKTLLIAQRGGQSPRYTEHTCVINADNFFFIPVSNEAVLRCSDFGDYHTIRSAMNKIASDLKVWRDNDGINIKVASCPGVFTSRNDGEAIRYCVRTLGLGEDDTRSMLKDASHKVEVYKYVGSAKTAAELLEFPQIMDTDLGGFMSSFHRSQVPFRTKNTAQPENNREFYSYQSPFGSGAAEEENNTFGIVDEASKTGQKEVFDAAALGSLIKAHNPTDLVDRFIPTITAGMDRIGRMLFLIYWHYKDFENRYGEKELSEFIDNLRSVFEQIGDIIVFAKKRTLAGEPDHYGMAVPPASEEIN